jgi:transcription elongation factor GreA
MNLSPRQICRGVAFIMTNLEELIMSQEPQVTWLTQEAYDRLAAELNDLSTTGRHEIAQRIAAAREEGDLKENGGYHAAKDEQGKQEARIRTLTQLLRDARVGDAPAASNIVEPGTVVTATIAGEKTRFLIGNREMAEGSDLDVYSELSPLCVAILGLKVGMSTTYSSPANKEIAVTITGVETYSGQ